jgi:glycosyltransferase involved in cell wall biosynthesis
MRVNPSISVLMPAYNAGKYIGESIDSILKQTYKGFELLISDDASTDNTWSLIQEYAKKDKRIQIFQNKKNVYIAENRNKLIERAKGKYIAWQDADDISLPTRLEKQYKFMEEHREVGIVGGYLQFFNEKGNTSIRRYKTDDVSLRRTIFRYSPVAQPAAMIRKAALDEMGKYNPKYPPAEDIDMTFRIGKKYKFANLPEIVIRYREHHMSATYKKLKKIELDTLEIRKKYAKEGYYKMSILDKLYNILQYISIYIIPPRMKILLFSYIRNDR